MDRDRVNHRLLAQRLLGLAGILFLLVGCAGFVEVTPNPAGETPSTLNPDPTPGATPRPSPQPPGAVTPDTVRATATPTSCLGWNCTVEGTVYGHEAKPGNELPGVCVTLSHFSNCSPTRGEHETVTDQDGTFVFEAYLHDTDMFRFEVEEEGYAPVRLQIGGFDCLYCSCSPVEIVLEP